MAKQSIGPEMAAAIKALDAGASWDDIKRRLESVEIKGDPLKGWTGSPPFHLDRQPPCTCGAATEGKWKDKHERGCPAITSAESKTEEPR